MPPAATADDATSAATSFSSAVKSDFNSGQFQADFGVEGGLVFFFFSDPTANC